MTFQGFPRPIKTIKTTPKKILILHPLFISVAQIAE